MSALVLLLVTALPGPTPVLVPVLNADVRDGGVGIAMSVADTSVSLITPMDGSSSALAQTAGMETQPQWRQFQDMCIHARQ